MAKKSAKSVLKAKGLIPKEWDLRKTLSAGQKSWITKQERKYSEVIKHPEKFQSRTYSNATVKKLKGAGYFGEGNRILIPNFGDKSSRTTVNEDTITVRRTLRNGETVTEIVYLHSGPELLKRLQRKFSKPLPSGEFWAFRVGDNNTFLSNHTKTLGQLMHYGQSIEFRGNKDAVYWAQRHMHLVRFRYDDGKDHRQMQHNPNNPTEYHGRKKKWQNKRGK
jgi:hypothetical protein